MIEAESVDWFQLLALHYSLVDTFKENPKYSYKAIGILKRSDTFVLKYKVVETNKSQYESEEDYRTDTIFNQEPRVYQKGKVLVS